MASVLLGSTTPRDAALGTSVSVNGESAKEDNGTNMPEQTVVLIDTPEVDNEGNTIPLDKQLTEIREAFALHSKEPAAWVEGTDEEFTKMVSKVFGCDVNRPDAWDPPVKAQEASSDLTDSKVAESPEDISEDAKSVSESDSDDEVTNENK